MELKVWSTEKKNESSLYYVHISNLLLFIFLTYSIEGTAFGIKLQIFQCKNNCFELRSFVVCIMLHSWILQINARDFFKIYLRPKQREIDSQQFIPMGVLTG